MPRRLLRLLAGLLLAGPACALAWQPETTVELTWHSNVTNADRTSDRLGALQSRATATGHTFRQLSGRDLVSAAWAVHLDAWPRYQGLDVLSAEPTLGWRHKLGLGPQALVIATTATGLASAGRESGRSGLGHTLRLEVSRRFGDAWQVFLGTECTRYDARAQAFSHTGRENNLRLEYQVGPAWLLTAEFRQRAGIVVSYTTPPRPDLVASGKVLTLVDTFERAMPLLAYYFPADTRSAAFSLRHDLGHDRAVTARFEYRESTHNALRYLNTRFSLGLTQSF